MSRALIGYTGFVGGNLRSQTYFDDFYNSKNIEDIQGKQYEFLICAGAPAAKWVANQNPREDYLNIRRLMDNLGGVSVETFVLISTVDVYDSPQQVYESTQIDLSYLEPYGRHRRLLEKFVEIQFPEVTIIRLPGLFGTGLKKNIIFDLLHNNALHLTHYRSIFQFYDLRNLWQDLRTSLQHDLRLVNFSTEPVSVDEIASRCFTRKFRNITDKPPVLYDMRSEHTKVFNDAGDYLYDKETVLAGIRDFVVTATLRKRT